jgi:hypothetical protein
LLVAGVVSLLQTLFPIRVGDAEWEVGAVGQAAATAAVWAIGWGVIVWLSLTDPRLRWLARVMGFLGVAIAVGAAFGALLVATNIPLVWEAAKQSQSLARATAYKSAAVKAASLSGLYALFFLGFSAAVLRTSFTRK